MNRRHDEAQERFRDRRRREDDAPRLLAEIPELLSLRLDVDERTAGSPFSSSSHIRRIVVENAPALFLVACGDPSCRDGGHDLTSSVMHFLRQRATAFEDDDECRGQTRMAECRRVIHYSAVATYRS